MKYVVLVHKKDIYEAALEGEFRVLERYDKKQDAMNRIRLLRFRYNSDEYEVYMREFEEHDWLYQKLFRNKS